MVDAGAVVGLLFVPDVVELAVADDDDDDADADEEVDDGVEVEFQSFV